MRSLPRAPEPVDLLSRSPGVPTRWWAPPWPRRRPPDPRVEARRAWRRYWRRLVDALVAAEGGAWWGRRRRALRRRPWILVASVGDEGPRVTHPPSPDGAWRAAGEPIRSTAAVLVNVTWMATPASASEDVARRGAPAALAALRGTARCPAIDLVVLRLPVALLASGAGARRQEVARTLRHAMRSLREAAGVDGPLHVLVEELDTLPGFERFVRLTRHGERERPWGWVDGASLDAAGAFDAWWARAEDDALARFHACTHADPVHATRRRAELFAWPRRLRALRAGWIDLRERLREAGGGEEGIGVRGVWFTGRGAVPAPGTPAGPAAVLDPAAPFLGDLLGRAWPAEARLATPSPSFRARLARRRRAGQGLLVAAMLLACTWRAAAWWQEAGRVGRLEDDVQSLEPGATTAPEAWPLLASLDGLARDGGAARSDAASSSGPSSPASSSSSSFAATSRWGLRQASAAVRQAARRARDRLAAATWWPRLQARLVERLDPGLPPDERYEALRVQRMLHEPARYDAHAVAAWWRQDRARAAPSPAEAAIDPQVLARLLEAGPPVPWPEAPDAVLAQARATLRGRPLSEAVAARWRAEERTQPAATFRVSDAAGPDAARVFRRASGEPLSAPLPGEEEPRALQRLAARAPVLAEALLEESAWVLGEPVPASDREARVRSAVDEARRSQAARAAHDRDRLLGDLRLGPATAGAGAGAGEDFAALAQRLSQPGSPLERLVLAVAREAAGGAPPSASPADSAPGRGWLPAPEDGGADDTAARWRRWGTDPADASSPLARLREGFREAATQWRTADGQDRGPVPLPAGEAAGDELRARVVDAPAPLRRWIEDLVDRWQAAHGARRARAWQSAADEDLGGWCRQAIAGRYPFAADGRDEVPLADLVALFAPGGRFDQFVARQAGSAWHAATARGPGAGAGGDLPPALRATLSGAARVRDAFFGGGRIDGADASSPARPSLAVALRLSTIEPAGAEVRLTVPGRTTTWRHADDPPLRWTWPEAAPSSLRLELVPPASDGRPPATVVSAAGPWALFRLLDAGRVRTPAPARPAERLSLSFAAGGVRAVFDWQADSVRHPWSLEALRGFRCPGPGGR